MSTNTFRVIHINDVYELDQFPYLKTLIEEKTVGCDRLIVTLGGDFLAPSLLSGIDNGYGMIDIMKLTGITHVCFGNHETDVPAEAMRQRIVDFCTLDQNGHKGIWINSNMLGYKCPVELPEYVTEESVSADKSNKRKVALIGLLCHHQSLYLPTAFGGAVSSLTPVNETAIKLNELLKPTHDVVLPLTHQALVDDRLLGHTGVFPIILGGHDHQEYIEKYDSGSVMIKAGMDAHKALVLDFTWADGSVAKPEVKYELVTLKEGREPNKALLEEVRKHALKVQALDLAILFRDENRAPLTSKGIRLRPVSVGTLVCTTCRDELGVDAVFLDAGAIRAATDYPDGRLTLSNIRKEIPFDTDICRIQLPGNLLSEVLKYSRRNEETIESGGFYQTDSGIKVDPLTRDITHVHGTPIDPTHTYTLGMMVTSVNGMNNNQPLIQYFQTHEKPESDSGFPAKPLIVKNFCKKLWAGLPSFGEIDVNGDGRLSAQEVLEAYVRVFADVNGDGVIDDVEVAAAKIVVEHLIGAANLNDDDVIEKEEYDHLLHSLGVVLK